MIHSELTKYLQLEQQKKLNVAVVGVGAVGGYYGSKLHEAGHDVHFYMRPGRNYEVSKRNGLTIHSANGTTVIGNPQVYSTTKDMATAVPGGFDWVVIALKSSAMDVIPDLLAPLSTSRTKVLVLMNGLVEGDLMRLLSKHEVRYHTMYGGMAFICAERVAPAVIEHRKYGSLSVGVACTWEENWSYHQDAVTTLFEPSGVSATLESCLTRARWKKQMVNLPFNGLAVAMGGLTVDKITSDPGLRKMALSIMDESAEIANAELRLAYGEGNFVPIGEKEKVAMMTWCDGVGEFKTSTMVDFIKRRPMEVRFIFREALLRAQKHKIHAPFLEAVVLQVEAYQRLYNLF